MYHNVEGKIINVNWYRQDTETLSLFMIMIKNTYTLNVCPFPSAI